MRFWAVYTSSVRQAIRDSFDPDSCIEKVGADFSLKKSHFYYAQVQGQLALTGLPWCDFCVYLSDSNEMCVDRIHFDSDFWENDLPKLKNFFFFN